jgi:hypothetical protein
MNPPDQTLAADAALYQAVGAIRRRWRIRRILEGVPALIAAAIVALLIGLAIRAAIASPVTIIVASRVVGYALLAGVLVRFVVIPAFWRASDEQIALYVEEQAPELRQLLVSAVYEIRHQIQPGESESLRQRVIERATAEMDRLERGAVIERPRTRRALARLGALVVAGALLIALGPATVRDMARVLFVPWSRAAAATIPRLTVAPGNVSIPRGAALDVRADVSALADHGAEIVVRADSADEWVRIPMVRDSTSSGYVVRLFDVNQSTTYYIDAGPLRSPSYRITVTDLPTVRTLAIELRFPSYTGLPPQKIDNGGDVVAVKGTAAELTITPTLPVTGGSLHFDDGSSIPLARTADGGLTGTFKVARDGFYRIDMVAADGTQVPGSIQHSVEALVDHPPTVRIDKPGRDTKVSTLEEVAVSATWHCTTASTAAPTTSCR